jgi:hypothetical protein
MPKVAKKEVAVKKKENNGPLGSLLALAAHGGIIKTVERESARLRVTYVNGVTEVFTFNMPWQAVLVVMTLKDLNTCIAQAKVTRVTKEKR